MVVSVVCCLNLIPYYHYRHSQTFFVLLYFWFYVARLSSAGSSQLDSQCQAACNHLSCMMEQIVPAVNRICNINCSQNDEIIKKSAVVEIPNDNRLSNFFSSFTVFISCTI